MTRPFLKMNGLGNDFVVVETRSAPFAPTPDEVRAIADRATGIGCDQLIVVEPSDTADAHVRFWNADGEEVSACGNGTRCVAWLLMQSAGKDSVAFDTVARFLDASGAVPADAQPARAVGDAVGGGGKLREGPAGGGLCPDRQPDRGGARRQAGAERRQPARRRRGRASRPAVDRRVAPAGRAGPSPNPPPARQTAAG